jgi:hypothetical protein
MADFAIPKVAIVGRVAIGKRDEDRAAIAASPLNFRTRTALQDWSPGFPATPSRPARSDTGVQADRHRWGAGRVDPTTAQRTAPGRRGQQELPNPVNGRFA